MTRPTPPPSSTAKARAYAAIGIALCVLVFGVLATSPGARPPITAGGSPPPSVTAVPSTTRVPAPAVLRASSWWRAIADETAEQTRVEAGFIGESSAVMTVSLPGNDIVDVVSAGEHLAIIRLGSDGAFSVERYAIPTGQPQGEPMSLEPGDVIETVDAVRGFVYVSRAEPDAVTFRRIDLANGADTRVASITLDPDPASEVAAPPVIVSLDPNGDFVVAYCAGETCRAAILALGDDVPSDIAIEGEFAPCQAIGAAEGHLFALTAPDCGEAGGMSIVNLATGAVRSVQAPRPLTAAVVVATAQGPAIAYQDEPLDGAMRALDLFDPATGAVRRVAGDLPVVQATEGGAIGMTLEARPLPGGWVYLAGPTTDPVRGDPLAPLVVEVATGQMVAVLGE